MAGQADLRALGVADHLERGGHGPAVARQAAGTETQILAVLDDEGAHDHDLAHAGPGLRPQPDVLAHAISTEVARRLTSPRALRVLGSGRGALHLDLDGFVVTLTAPGVPRMPNGVAVDRVGEAPRVGWDAGAPPLWNPVVAPSAGGADAVGRLSRWLAARTTPPDLTLAAAPAALLGRGPGLTPEGDDVLAGAALGVRALGPAAGLDAAAVDALASALCPADVGARTNALSATLLRLAAAGAAPEPVHRLLAPGDRETALGDLRRLGASTGAAIASGIALAARHLARAPDI